MRLLSFGGGVQTTALAVMLCRGEIEAEHIVMADTGGERPDTYAHVATVSDYLAAHGRTLEIVRHNGSSLEDYVLNKSTVIPVITPRGLGRRQCTAQWKIRPIKAYARARGAKHLTMLLGISVDEIFRIKPDREKWVTREYPLVDRNLTRSDCRRIVQEAGLPDPPKSSCFYCPLQRTSQWQWLASTEPGLFARAAAMEEAVQKRSKVPVYLSGSRRPLSKVAHAEQTMLGAENNECEGVCFV